MARVLAALLALGGARAAQDGKLEDVRGEVRGGSDDEEPEPEHEWDDDWKLPGLFDDEEGRDPFEALFDNTVGVVIEYTVLLPFAAPRQALADVGFARGAFQPYPQRDAPGYWLTGEAAAGGRDWSSRPRAEFASDFDDLERVGFGLQLEHAGRFGFDGAWSRWREDLGAGTDELDLYDANLVYRFAQGPRAAFRAGLGLNGLHDAGGDDLGLNATYGADFLVGEFATLGFELDLGTLGDARLLHLRPTLGLVLERFELFASFDHHDLDGAELRSYGLGLRAWF